MWLQKKEEEHKKDWAPGADDEDEKQLGVQAMNGKEWDWRRQAGPEGVTKNSFQF